MSATTRSARIGVLLTIAYCVIISAQSVVEGGLVQNMSPEFVAFNVFLVAQVFYLLVCRDRTALAAAVRRNRRDLLYLNLATAVSWVAILYALVGLQPVVVNTIVIGLSPFCTLLVGLRLRRTARPHPLELIALAGTLASMVYLTVLNGQGGAGLGPTGLRLAFELVACVATAIGMSATVVFTKRLTEAGMTVSQIMASRFTLLVPATVVILLVRRSFGTYSLTNILVLAALGAVGVIFALHLLQMAITRTEPITVALLFSSGAALTYLMQFFDPRLHQSWAVSLGILGFTASMVLGIRSRTSAGGSSQSV